jgi:hypothetical protein
VVFPSTYPAVQAQLDPLEMCQRFTGTSYFPCQASESLAPRCPTPLPTNTQPKGSLASTLPAMCNTLFSKANPDQTCGGGCGTDLSQLDPNQNKRAGHSTYIVGPIAPFAQNLTYESINMTYERWQCSGQSGDVKAAKLKSWLECGPIMTCINPPGHWVLVTGYRDGTIYICDPGAVICGTKWLTQGHARIADDADPGHQGYITVSDGWLSIVTTMDKITFPTAMGEGENASWFQ